MKKFLILLLATFIYSGASAITLQVLGCAQMVSVSSTHIRVNCPGTSFVCVNAQDGVYTDPNTGGQTNATYVTITGCGGSVINFWTMKPVVLGGNEPDETVDFEDPIFE
jgi:hypothetical protein